MTVRSRGRSIQAPVFRVVRRGRTPSADRDKVSLGWEVSRRRSMSPAMTVPPPRMRPGEKSPEFPQFGCRRVKDELAQDLARLALVLHEQPDVEQTAERLLEYVRVTVRASHASVVLVHRGGRLESVAATDALAEVIADHAAVAVANAKTESTLWQAIQARKLIGQAQGILMERFDLTDEQAFAVLRRYSQDSNTKLRDVAQRLIATRNLS